MSRKIVGVLLVAAALALAATPASARGARVGIGIGFGFPLFAYGPPVYYPPPPAYYYAPPPVVYAPPPMAATPTGPAYVGRSGAPCREFQTSGLVGGRMEQLYGTACQQPDGSWRVVR
jgi:hypothetical protein